MAGERTPLFSATGTAPRRDKRVFYAKIAAGVALVGALGAVVYSTTRGGSDAPAAAPVATASLGASITDDNWFCGETNFETDYIKLSDKKGDDEYFYWFVPSRSEDPSKDPLVLWLTGGPGSSSMLALLTENGPCMVDPNVTTRWNRYAWNNEANVVWLDQPSGVGFSDYDKPEDADYTEADVGPNMWAFMNGFLDKHPEFVGRDFYITGESYGGHYIPGSSHYIWQQNKKLAEGEPKRINLKGIAIGNGLTNPNIQYKYNQDMAYNQYNITLLTEAQIEQMKKDSVECIALAEQCQAAPKNGTICVDAQGCWQEKLIAPFNDVHRNPYDFRQECPPDHPEVCGTGYLNDYFALDVVKKHLSVVRHPWRDSNPDVYKNYVSSGDWTFAYHTYVADLLNDGLRVLIYAGDTDLMCNWIGNHAWTLDLEWKGKDGYNKAEEHAFKTQDPYVENAPVVDAGVARQFENFAFVRVYESGHMVPTNQPAVSWVLLDKFLNGQQL